MKYKISKKGFFLVLCFVSAIWTQASQPKNNKLSVTSVTASSWETTAAGGWGDFLPEFVIDGDLSASSSFRAEGDGQWIKIDLGKKSNIDHVSIKFLPGNDRKYKFDLATSTDDISWNKLLDHQLSLGSDTFEEYLVKKKARYIRLTGYGNTHPQYPEWFNIVELEVYGNQ